MSVNRDKPDRWKSDAAQSIDFYNQWFVNFAPRAYRDTRVRATREVEAALDWTSSLTVIEPEVLNAHPEILPALRMSTAPPLARDRLIGLAQVSPSLVKNMEIERRLPSQMAPAVLFHDLASICRLIKSLLDVDIFPWIETGQLPLPENLYRAATIVADRLCGAVTDPIIRNAQQARQRQLVKSWLESRRYALIEADKIPNLGAMPSGTFSFEFNVQVEQAGGRVVKIPIDIAIMPLDVQRREFPLLIETKSAGDFTNTNKRRKEEATKIAQLRHTYGANVELVLFLCGYFDSGYLGYEAAEGIDWVWEHRIDDLTLFGV
jgi:hypothetical protein